MPSVSREDAPRKRQPLPSTIANGARRSPVRRPRVHPRGHARHAAPTGLPCAEFWGLGPDPFFPSPVWALLTHLPWGFTRTRSGWRSRCPACREEAATLFIRYRLPEVRRAVHAVVTVYLVPNEEITDHLAGVGLAATTTPIGSLAHCDGYEEVLRGAQVHILPSPNSTRR